MVKSASVLLRRHGVHGTTFPLVLEHAGAPRGSITHHFPGGKTEMLVDAVTLVRDEVSDRLRRAADDGASSQQLLSGICDYFAEWLTRTDFTASCPVAAVAEEAFDDDALGSAAAGAIEAWVEIVATRLRSEGHDRRTAQGLAMVCVASVEGALLMARVQRTLAPLQAVRVHVGRLVAA